MVRAISKVLVLFCTLYFLHSCSILAIKREYKYAKEGFDLNKYYQSYYILDTNTFYYKIYDDIFSVDTTLKASVHCLKFYSDGRFQSQPFNNSVPDVESLLNPSENLIHYYKIEEGILKLELWRDGMAGFGYWEGKIYEDSLVFYKVNNVKDHQIYLKKK